jgi:hypothetical protein
LAFVDLDNSEINQYRYFVNIDIEMVMVKAKKKVGRPPGRANPNLIQVLVSDDQLARIDEWRRSQADLPARSEAMRRMIDIVTGPKARGSK